jgi:nuclear pore complex protein Nup93
MLMILIVLLSLFLVSLSPVSPPALNLPMIIWRYVRQFAKMDANEALQYVYCVGLTVDQSEDVGKEQMDTAWELVRRIIVMANSGPAWESLVGGFRSDGQRYVSVLIVLPIDANTFTLIISSH